jgi:predicted transcriptional regulator
VHYTSGKGARVPNQPATPNRNVRVPDELWDEVLRIAADQHETATEIVLRALRAYVRRYPAE